MNEITRHKEGCCVLVGGLFLSWCAIPPAVVLLTIIVTVSGLLLVTIVTWIMILLIIGPWTAVIRLMIVVVAIWTGSVAVAAASIIANLSWITIVTSTETSWSENISKFCLIQQQKTNSRITTVDCCCNFVWHNYLV